jgi:hypothetical protein
MMADLLLFGSEGRPYKLFFLLILVYKIEGLIPLYLAQLFPQCLLYPWVYTVPGHRNHPCYDHQSMYSSLFLPTSLVDKNLGLTGDIV